MIQVSSKLQMGIFVLYLPSPFLSQYKCKGFTEQDSEKEQTVGGDQKMKPQSSQGTVSDW